MIFNNIFNNMRWRSFKSNVIRGKLDYRTALKELFPYIETLESQIITLSKKLSEKEKTPDDRASD